MSEETTRLAVFRCVEAQSQQRHTVHDGHEPKALLLCSSWPQAPPRLQGTK